MTTHEMEHISRGGTLTIITKKVGRETDEVQERKVNRAPIFSDLADQQQVVRKIRLQEISPISNQEQCY